MSPSRLLLFVCSPNWNAANWICSQPRKEWPKALTSLWSLSEKVEKRAFLSGLPTEQVRSLRTYVSSLKLKRGRVQKSNLKLEVLFLLQAASLQVAEEMGKRASWSEKRTWLLRWFKSSPFFRLTESALFSDECIDRILGLYERKVQHRLKDTEIPKSYQEEALYLDLDPEDLYTPYRVICRWGRSLKLKPKAKVVDLGSGVGRIPLTLGLLFPEVSFVGIEIMKERHEMAEKAQKGLRLKNVRFLCTNAAKRGLPIADYYYFFNPFVGDTLRQVFRQLKNQSSHRDFRIAVAQIELPWSYVRKLNWLKPIQTFKADQAWEGIGITTFGLCHQK